MQYIASDMIKEERQQLIIKHIRERQSVYLSDLSALLNVSEDTVRRDIKILSDQGLLKAVRGGAVAHSPTPHHFRDREHFNVQHKELIAKKALQFIKDGQLIIFDGGTSALAVAAALPKDIHITAVTNSFPIVNVLEDHPKAEVLFAGGRLNKHSFATTGHDAIQLLRSVRADLAFLGICSIDITMGITTVDYEDGQVKKAIVDSSKHIIALSTVDKIGTAESYHICAANAIQTIITDVDPGEENRLLFTAAGIEII